MDFVDLCEYPLEVLEANDSNGPITIDTETLGATRETNIPIYFSWAAKDLGAGAGPTTTQGGHDFLRALCNSLRRKIFANAKFDISVLKRIGFVVCGEIEDVILMHALLDEHHLEAHRVKALSRELLGRARINELKLKEELKRVKFLSRVPQGLVHEYAADDAIDEQDLFYLLKPQLEEQGLWELYRNEVAAELVYMMMGEEGVLVDVQAIEETAQQLDEPIAKLAAEIHLTLGGVFKISSPAQLGNALRETGFPLTKKTKTGQWKTDADTLHKWINDPRIQFIQAYKFLTRARSTLLGYAKRVDEKDYLHPDYRQTTTAGRSACSDPNLQAIPHQRGRVSEIEVGSAELAKQCADAFRQTRRIFIAPPGAAVLPIDYKQIEYRDFVHYSGSKRLIDELRAGADFHEMVSLLVWGEHTPRLRHLTKIINYGLLYGMGEYLLRLQLQREGFDPRDVLQRYEKMLPEMRETQKRLEATARKRGYVVDVFGRRYRYLADFPWRITAWICQGTAANVKKYSMVRVNKILRGRRSRIALDIHDELDLYYYPEDSDLLPEIVRTMEDYPQFDVPIKVDLAIGPNLLDAKEMPMEQIMDFLKGMDNDNTRNVTRDNKDGQGREITKSTSNISVTSAAHNI